MPSPKLVWCGLLVAMCLLGCSPSQNSQLTGTWNGTRRNDKFTETLTFTSDGKLSWASSSRSGIAFKYNYRFTDAQTIQLDPVDKSISAADTLTVKKNGPDEITVSSKLDGDTWTMKRK